MTQSEIEPALRRYADGLLGTRAAIQAIGARDYADLVIAMAQANLAFPKPSATPTHAEHVARARALLQPLLRHAP